MGYLYDVACSSSEGIESVRGTQCLCSLRQVLTSLDQKLAC